MSSPAAPALSVVVPVFDEAGNVAPLCAEIVRAVEPVTPWFEIVFVNDGSRDGTLAELRALRAHEPRLRIVDLDGNFGEAAALSAGFHCARGGRVVTLDGDGQNDPCDIPRLLAALDRHGVSVASGWRQRREESLLIRVLPSVVANRLIAALTRLPVHDCGCGLKAYERGALGSIQLPRGMNRFLPAILGVKRFEVVEIKVNDRRREHGRSHYGLSRTAAVLRDLPALPFLVTRPRRWEPVFALLAAFACAGLVILGAKGGRGLAFAMAGTGLLSALVWWNLRRFNRAQGGGVYRVRAEFR